MEGDVFVLHFDGLFPRRRISCSGICADREPVCLILVNT